MLIFTLYLSANAIAFVQGVSDGGMLLDGSFFELDQVSLFFSFITICGVLFSFLFVFKFFDKSIIEKNKIVLRWKYGITLVILQVSFLIFNSVMGLNVAGGDSRPENGSLLNYFFMLLQPDILFMLTALFLASERLFLINLLVFLLSMFLRGWMGGVFIVINIAMIRYYPIRLSMKTCLSIVFSVVIVFLLLPAIIDAKWAMRLGISVSDFINSLSDSFTLEKYNNAIGYVINRFQHVGHVALLLENSAQVYKDFENGIFIGYWMDGLPQHTLAKILSFDTYKINSYMVTHLYNIPDAIWNTNPGISGWILILGSEVLFVILYLLLIMVFPFWFVQKYAGKRMLMLMSFFSLIYLFHGWFGAYFNIAFYAVLVVVFYRLRCKPIAIPLASINKVTS